MRGEPPVRSLRHSPTALFTARKLLTVAEDCVLKATPSKGLSQESGSSEQDRAGFSMELMAQPMAARHNEKVRLYDRVGAALIAAATNKK